MAIADGSRRAEILSVADGLFASSGIRVSVTQIAEACGIKPGSLYHHFESKEAIVVELVERFRAELDEVAAAALGGDMPDGSGSLGAIVMLGEAIAACASRNRAAVLFRFYEPPSAYGQELAELLARTPVAIESAMGTVIERARSEGLVREPVAIDGLARHLCELMAHLGLGDFGRERVWSRTPSLTCEMLIGGLSPGWPPDCELDRSTARRAADVVIEALPDADESGSTAARVLAAARIEFARRGYQATTIRDVMSAAKANPRSVYRVAESKEALLAAVLEPYAASLADGWNAVLGADATALEKVDALLWLNINIVARFPDEHRVQSVSLPFVARARPQAGLSYPAQIRHIYALLAEADRTGGLREYRGHRTVRNRCVFALLWTPAPAIARHGVKQAFEAARETVVRGAATRP